VGGALRQYRENLGYTLDDAARVLECDRSKISRIETGQRGIRNKELNELLTEFGVDDQARDALAAIADLRGRNGWWRAYADILPDAYQDYLVMEAAATRIRAYEPHRVPELFQTPGYARTLAEVDPALEDDTARDRAVEARLVRQRVVLKERAPYISVVIGEAALQQAVGGATVMRAQLALLAKVGLESERVSVQVLPFDVGVHAAGVGPLTILQFAGTLGLGVVHLGGATGGVCLEGSGDLAIHERAFEQMRMYALPSVESARLLRELAER
jgi:transcriptional regulator with XRE-family HTH domain